MALQILIEELFHPFRVHTNHTIGLQIIDHISCIEEIVRCERVPMLFLQGEMDIRLELQTKHSYCLQTIREIILTDHMHMEKRHRWNGMITISKVSKWTTSSGFRRRSETVNRSVKFIRRRQRDDDLLLFCHFLADFEHVLQQRKVGVVRGFEIGNEFVRQDQ